MTGRRVEVGYDWKPDLGDCVVLEVDATDEKFLVPFDQAVAVATAMLSLLAEGKP